MSMSTTTVTNEGFHLRPVHDVLLFGSAQIPVGLFQLQLATAEQLTRLHYSPKSIKLVKKRLKVLTQHGYVQADAIPTRTHGTPFYYTMSAKGMKYLESLGIDTSEAWRQTREVDKHALFLYHTLEINDVIIAAALLQRTEPKFYLHQFTHERELKRHPVRVQWDGEHGRQTYTVIPDAFLDFRVSGTKLGLHVLLEHDRGTEEQYRFKQKIRAYLVYLKADGDVQQFGKPPAIVAFTTFEGAARLEKMRDWTQQVLAAANEGVTLGSRFLFAAMPKPLLPGTAWLEPQWHLAYDSDSPAQPLLAS